MGGKNGKTTDTLTEQGRKVMLAIAALKTKPYVDVGVVAKDFGKSKKGHDGQNSGTTLGDVAVANEFGTQAHVGSRGPVPGIPARSFIRSTTDEKYKEWAKEVERLHDLVLEGKMTTDEALGRLGERIKRDIQAKMRSNIAPANAPSTIARKLGRSGLGGRKLRKAEIAAAFGQGTLRDTGQLLNSMAWEIGRGLAK